MIKSTTVIKCHFGKSDNTTTNLKNMLYESKCKNNQQYQGKQVQYGVISF